jgi:hypothetical protein
VVLEVVEVGEIPMTQVEGVVVEVMIQAEVAEALIHAVQVHLIKK